MTEQVTTAGWHRVNAWRSATGDVGVRPGLRRIYTPDAGRTIVGAFPVPSEFTGEHQHFIFTVATTGPKALRLDILTEDFEVFQRLNTNVDAVPSVITHAVVQGQILICAPEMPTLWGLVGSGVRFAMQIDSDSNLTAIAVPRGIVTSWSNRAVICSGSNMFISDPVAATGGSLRTFLGANQNQRPGVIYGVHEGAGGSLVVVTTAGTYGLDSSAAAVNIVGSNGSDWRLLSHHAAYSFASSCVVRGRVFALTADGWAPVDVETNEEQTLTESMQPRAFGPRISIDDYRSCRIYGGEAGPVVAADAVNAVHCFDMAAGFASWWRSSHSPTDFVMRGLLTEPGGGELFVAANGVFRVDGNFDGEVALTSGVATQPKGIMFGVLPGTPSQSRAVRHVTAAGGVGGSGSVRVALRGTAKAGAPPADNVGVTIGTSRTGRRYITTPLASVRCDFPEAATDDVALEVAVDGCLSRINEILDVEYSPSAPMRPLTIGS